MKSASGIIKAITGLLIVIIALLLVVRYVMPNFVEKQVNTTYNFNPGQLRAETKIVIWEQDFSLSFTEKREKKYFNSDWLKFTESIAASAKGKMGFHIDLSDEEKTKIKFDRDTVFIETPLELTYVQIDLGTIEMIKKASIDPTLNLSKDSIIHKLDQKAIREFLTPTIETIKMKSVNKQEKALSRLTGKPVVIKFNDVPTVQSTINDWWSKQ